MATSELRIRVLGEDRASGPLGGVLRSIQGIATVAGGMLTAGLFQNLGRQVAAMGREALQATADYELLAMSLQSLAARELRNTDTTLTMGEAMALSADRAEELLNWTTQLALKSPFDQAGVANAFRTAMAYGFTTDQAQRLTRATIDMATATGASTQQMNQIALALGQVQAKGRLQGQEILQLVNAGIPALQMLANYYGITTAEAQKMVEQGLVPANEAFEAIVGTLEDDFAGAAERSSESWAGLINAFEDLKQMGLRALFEGIGRAMQPVVASFAEWLQGPGLELLADWGRRIGEFAGRLVELGGAIAEWVTQSRARLEEFGAGLQTWVLGAVEWLRGRMPGALAGLGQTFSQAWEWIKATAIEVWDTLKDVFNRQFLQSLRANASDALNNLRALWNEHGESLIRIIGAALAVVVTTVGNLLGILLGVFTAFTFALRGDWQGAAGALQRTWQNFLNSVLGLTGSNLQEFNAIWRGNLELAREIAVQAIQRVLDFFRGLPGQFRQAGINMMNGLRDGIVAAARSVADAAVAAANGIVNSVKGALGISSPSAVMREIGEHMQAGLQQGLSRNAGGIAAGRALALSAAGQIATTLPAGAGRGGSIDITINVNGIQDPAAVVRYMKRELGRELKPLLGGIG